MTLTTGPLTQLPSLDRWLSDHGKEIADAIEFCRCTLDPTPERLNELSAEVNAMSANLGYLLSDCESYLVGEKARAIKDMPEDLGPTSQKAFVEDRTKDLRRLRDNLKVTVRSLRSISINIFGIRKATR